MGTFRVWIRDLVGYRSPLYVFMANVLAFFYACSREGFAGVRVIRMRSHGGPGVWIRLRKLMFPIFIRPGTADVESIIDNVFREEYGRFRKGFTPKVIVDAGAYIGDTSAYFLSRFPDARLVALEPNPDSFALAQRNLAVYQDRVSLLQKALWNLEGIVLLGGEQTGAAIAQQGISVETITVEGLLKMMAIERLDLLKMDIEGAEVTVLETGVGGWLRKVDVLLLETHGKDIEDRLIPLLKREGFLTNRHRNIWYCTNVEAVLVT